MKLGPLLIKFTPTRERDTGLMLNIDELFYNGQGKLHTHTHHIHMYAHIPTHPHT